MYSGSPEPGGPIISSLCFPDAGSLKQCLAERSGLVGFLGPWGAEIGLRRVTRYGRHGHLIPEGSKPLAGAKRSATTREVCAPAGHRVCSNYTPQTRAVPEGRSDLRAHGALRLLSNTVKSTFGTF